MTMPHRAFFCALSLLFSATSLSDDNTRALLIGKWKSVTEIHDARIEGVSHYEADGTVNEAVDITQNGKLTTVRVKGTWKLDGDTIVAKYTESNAPALIALGEESRDRITFIDDVQLSIVDEEGTAVTFHRLQ